MKPSERPIVFGRNSAFRIDTPDPETVLITNTTQEWVSFVFLVVPSFVANATMFPWRRFLDQLRAPEGVLRAGREILYQLQQQYLDPRPGLRDKDPEEE